MSRGEFRGIGKPDLRTFSVRRCLLPPGALGPILNRSAAGRRLACTIQSSGMPISLPRGHCMSSSRRTPLLIIFLTVFIDLLGFGIVLPLLPRYAKHFQADGKTLGLLMASFSAMQFLFAPLWGRVSDRIGRRPILILGLAG